MTAVHIPSFTLYSRLLTHIKPYRRIFLFAIIAMIINAITEPALPALLQPLLDEGFVAKNSIYIQLIPLLLIIIVIIKGLSMLAMSVGITWVASHLVRDLRIAMFAKLLTLPTTTFDNLSAGVLLSKVTYDVTRVMEAATEALITLVRDSITIMGLLGLMFYLHWQLSLIIFTVLPLVIITIKFVSRQLRGLNTDMQHSMGDMTRVLEEAISGHKLVKVFGGHAYEAQRFHTAADRVSQLSIRIETTSGFSVFFIYLLTSLALALIIYIAALQSSDNHLTVGSFVALFTTMAMLYAPVKRLTKVNDQLQRGLAAAESVFNLIDQPAEIDTNQTDTPKNLRGAITFKQTTFTYPSQEKPALHPFTLTIQPTETIAFVGASGSGKTTLANLIPRFYNLPRGMLFIDDIDINDLPLNTLRANIALVSQEIILFNDTVAANIAYGTLAGASETAIHTAAKAAYASEFIEQMPNGFATMIGERGVKLSGGQRQRLAIARALLKNAPILIFDEATSALDTHSEHFVQQSLRELKHNKTTLIIAHRLSTIAHADRIVVMEQGKIVEIGTHHELLTKNGIYAKLYASQIPT